MLCFGLKADFHPQMHEEMGRRETAWKHTAQS
jgi:hypothetical protein